MYDEFSQDFVQQLYEIKDRDFERSARELDYLIKTIKESQKN